MSQAPYVAIAGNIGAGKSSFLEFLTRRFEFEPVYEPNETNPFLERFYADMPRWAFASQIWFLTEKVRLHRGFANSDRPIVQDRTIWEDAGIFAEHLARSGKMSPEEGETYRALYATLRTELRPPDLLIYLRCPVRTLRKRIAARGREMEQNLPVAYLKALEALYEQWYAAWDLSPRVVLDTSCFDPVTDLVDSHQAVQLLEKYL